MSLQAQALEWGHGPRIFEVFLDCLLYTSDAADD